MEGPYVIASHEANWTNEYQKWYSIPGTGLNFDDIEKAKDVCYMLNWAHKMRKLKEKESKPS